MMYDMVKLKKMYPNVDIDKLYVMFLDSPLESLSAPPLFIDWFWAKSLSTHKGGSDESYKREAMKESEVNNDEGFRDLC